MDIQILKQRYVALASEKPISQWSTEDAQLMSELSKDKEFDFMSCIAEIPETQRPEQMV